MPTTYLLSRISVGVMWSPGASECQTFSMMSATSPASQTLTRKTCSVSLTSKTLRWVVQGLAEIQQRCTISIRQQFILSSFMVMMHIPGNVFLFIWSVSVFLLRPRTVRGRDGKVSAAEQWDCWSYQPQQPPESAHSKEEKQTGKLLYGIIAQNLLWTS